MALTLRNNPAPFALTVFRRVLKLQNRPGQMVGPTGKTRPNACAARQAG
ncbi:MAG: hypothetical protein QNJ09_02865 [Paracoccaceae bacterium]|nr:hypothetical protein [Paracoccaceae bacterium]